MAGNRQGAVDKSLAVVDRWCLLIVEYLDVVDTALELVESILAELGLEHSADCGGENYGGTRCEIVVDSYTG